MALKLRTGGSKGAGIITVYLWDNRVGEVENGRSYGEDLEEGE